MKSRSTFHKASNVLHAAIAATLMLPAGAALAQNSDPEVEEVVEVEAQSPSEDFAYYLQEKPGSFFYVGAQPKDKDWYPHHHPKFDIDENSLLISAKSMAAVVAKYLG